MYTIKNYAIIDDAYYKLKYGIIELSYSSESYAIIGIHKEYQKLYKIDGYIDQNRYFEIKKNVMIMKHFNQKEYSPFDIFVPSDIISAFSRWIGIEEFTIIKLNFNAEKIIKETLAFYITKLNSYPDSFEKEWLLYDYNYLTSII